jgi:uncharacterized membrane protein YccC
MKNVAEWIVTQENPSSLVHATRTAIGATGAYLIAHAFHLPEAHWASISTMIVMQSTLGASLQISMQRLAGTAVGAVFGAAAAYFFPENFWAFGMSVFFVGLVCSLFRVQRIAYRYAGITLAVVMLVARTKNVWLVAAHRFVEVSLGIAVGLLLAAAWPERET